MTASSHPNEGEIAIAVAIDDKYAPHFATCVASLAAARGQETIRIYILRGPTLSLETVRTLQAYVLELGMQVEIVPIPPELEAGIPRTHFYPPLIWYRLLIPELLTHLKRIIVLDADLLVLQSLYPLFNTDLGSNLLAAVGTSAALVGPGDDERLLSLGLDVAAPYLNTGVMVMDLEAMRAERTGPRALALGQERGTDLMFPEQDSLNVAAQGRWKLLHPRWNAMSHLWLGSRHVDPTYSDIDTETARHSPAVVHFEGMSTVKPWHYRSVHPLRSLYRELRATTPWPLVELEGKTASAAVLRRLPLRSQYAIAQAKRRLRSRRSAH